MKTFEINTHVMWMQETDADYPEWFSGIITAVSDKYTIKCDNSKKSIVLDLDEVLEYDESTVSQRPDYEREMLEEVTINYKQEYENVYNDMCELADIVLGKDWGAENAIGPSDVSRQIVKAIKKRFKELSNVEEENVKLKMKKRVKKMVEVDEDEIWDD